MGLKSLRIPVLILVCVGVLLSAGCRKKSPSRLDEAVGGESRGPLGIVHAGPRGGTAAPRESDEIVVAFDHPMAPLADRPFDDRSTVFSLEPSVEGSFRWMGTRTLAFVPSNPLPRASAFKVTLPAGTRSLDGYELADDYTWTFETPRPRLLRHLPRDGADQLGLETEAVLVFDQPVDLAVVREHLAFTGADASGREMQPPFNLVRPEEKALRDAGIPYSVDGAVLLRPRTKLEPGFSYALEVRPGLTGREGSLPMEQGALFRFSTFNVFRFEEFEREDDGARDPGRPLIFRFSNRVTYKEFTEKIRIEPKVEIPEYYADWDYGNHSLWISLPLEPETSYTVTIPAGLKDDFGNILGRDETVAFTTGSLSPSVHLTTGDGVVEAYGDLTCPLFAVNTPRVRVQAARLSIDQVIPVLTAKNRWSARNVFQPWAGFYNYDRPLPVNLPRNVRGFVPLPLKDIEPDGHGFLFLQVHTYAEDEWLRYPKTFLQLTGLGLSGKFSPDNNVIWVSTLKTGQPAPEADVEIRDDKNRVLWRGRSGTDGRVETPGWKALGFRPANEWSKPRQWVFARLGEDAAMLSSDDTEGVEPYRFDIAYDWNPEPPRFQGTIFSERGIYRAGETVHLKGVLREREKGVWRIPAVREAEVKINDPFQKTVLEKKVPLDAFGSFAVDFESAPEAALGSYFVQASISGPAAGGRETSFGDSFRIEAFRPAEFEVLLKSGKADYVFGQTYEADIRASYLFGGALAGQKASWSLRLNPAWFSPKGHDGYVFGREAEEWDEGEPAEQSRLLGSAEAVLDKDGRLTVRVPLAAEKEKGTVSADLEATVQSPSRRSISNRIQTIIHRGEFYLGLKPSTSFLKKGKPLSVELIAARPDGALQGGRSAAVKLIKRDWRSARKAGLGGRLEWISEKSDTVVESQTIKTLSEGPVSVRFQPDKSGFYLIQAEARDGSGNEVSSSTYLYVTGDDYVAWERSDDDAIELVPDADSYRPGETARILVKSPYEKAKALVTVERESILKSEVVEISGSTAEIAVPVDAGMIPNVFVSVLLIQGRTTQASPESVDDSGKPSFKIGYVELGVDPAAKRLDIDIRPDRADYQPGDTVEIRFKAKDAGGSGAPASLAVAVVDLGVINLIGYQAPDLFSAFYGRRPLSVDTAESRVHVVGQRHFGEKGENPGGGGEGAMGAGLSLSEVELRGDFKSTAYWNPSVETDAGGEAVVTFKLPDNLTTFRIIAVAQTRDSRFGRGSGDFKVRKPLLLLPALPRLARVGDSFQGGVVVTNNGPDRGSVRMSLNISGLESADQLEKTVDLDSGVSTEVLFGFKAVKEGTARLAFRAEMNGRTDGLEAVFPVEKPRPLVTLGFTGQTDTSQEETVRIPDGIHPDLGGIEMRASASALNGLRARLSELVDYPYLCLEQRLSCLLPFLVAGPVIRDFKLTGLEPAEVEQMVRDSLREIYSCQKDNGGFSLWTDSPFDSPYVTAYAVFALLKAYDSGIPIDRSRLDRGLSYLRTILKMKQDSRSYPYNRRGWASVQAFALYDLALAGKPEAGYAEKLFQEREQLPLFGRALLLKAMSRTGDLTAAKDTLIREFLNKAELTAADAHFEESDPAGLSWTYSSNTRTTAVILQALLETGQTSPVLSGAARWLVQKKSAPGWSSPQENFFTFYALNEYYRRVEKGAPDFRAEIRLAEKVLLEETVRRPTDQFESSLPLNAFPSGRDLPFRAEKTGTGILYYSLRMSYAPLQPLPPRDEGLAVYKKIESLDGRPLSDIPAGSLAVVTLEIAVPKESLFVVVEDPLPAGFEAVNMTFRTESIERSRVLDELAEGDDQPWWAGFNHIEMHDNRVLLFADSLAAGVHRHRYLVRALTYGSFHAPAPLVQQMYAPETYGRGAEQAIRIVR
ncbi:MAG: Ig-like domain-containing protein [Candidatus Aminicenantes bacterium]|nr:Ig-like domain-containing protein [Candidatus Aminicenantes bacterium]